MRFMDVLYSESDGDNDSDHEKEKDNEIDDEMEKVMEEVRRLQTTAHGKNILWEKAMVYTAAEAGSAVQRGENNMVNEE